MLTSSKLPHLARIRQEDAEQQQHRILQDQSHVDDLSAQVFALTITDDGPKDFGLPNKLWTSRAELQASLHTPTPEVYPSLDDISESLQRLSVFDDVSHPDTPGSSTSQNHANDRRVSKREKHRATVVAHSILTTIASKAITCEQSLALPSSHPLLQKAESELTSLRLALENISRNVPSVNVRKEEVRKTLDKLDGRLVELRYLVPNLAEGPYAYNAAGSDYFSLLLALPMNTPFSRSSL
jgi:hypothetical protein